MYMYTCVCAHLELCRLNILFIPDFLAIIMIDYRYVGVYMCVCG